MAAFGTAILQGEVDAWKDRSTHYRKGFSGTVAQGRSVRFGSEVLTRLGWEHREVRGQVRLLSPESWGGDRFRLIHCKGQIVAPYTARVNRRGPETMLILESNLHLEDPVPSLFETVKRQSSTGWITAFSVSHVDPRGYMSLHLAVPLPIPGRKRQSRFHLAAVAELFTGRALVETAPKPLSELPPSVDPDIDLGEWDGFEEGP